MIQSGEGKKKRKKPLQKEKNKKIVKKSERSKRRIHERKDVASFRT